MESMDFEDEAMPPMEDSIQAFIGQLVDPLLNQYGRFEVPSPAAHEQVAKQMHAVVLLYNYYHRQQFPHLDFLDCITFCKTAVVTCAKLITYMGILKGTNQLASNFVQRATLTEKMVKEACDTCQALNSPRAMSDIKALPISKVAVFVVDAMCEKCVLIFGSITKGVWSLVEKVLDGCDSCPGGTLESEKSNCAKQTKEKKMSNKTVGFSKNSEEMPSGTSAIDTKLLQIAYSAVKEQTGIAKTDLEEIDDHLVYSLSQKKTSCRLFIMRCTKETPLKSLPDTEVKWVLVKEALASVEGPLLEHVSITYEAASTVAYFHLRPYYNVIHDWLARIKEDDMALKVPTNSVEHENDNRKVVDLLEDPIDMDVAIKSVTTGSQQVASPADSARHVANRTPRFSNKYLTHVKGKSTVIEKVVTASKDGGDIRKDMSNKHVVPVLHISSAIEQVTSPSKGGGHARRGMESLQGTLEQKMNAAEEAINANGRQAGGQQTCIPPSFAFSDGGMHQNNTCNGVQGVSFEQNYVSHRGSISKGLQENKISKEIDLSRAAVKIVSQNRDGLLEELITCQVQYQSRTKELHDAIAECDAKIEKILCDGEDATILAKQICHETSSIGKVKTSTGPSFIPCEEDVPIPSVKRRKLFQGILFLRSSFQELTEICMKNQWSLPSYLVLKDTHAKGCFRATVSVRGWDFELSEGGDLRNGEMEAKESAASYMLSKLHLISARSSE
eukprot:Gb_11674 [translate_table: standard]